MTPPSLLYVSTIAGTTHFRHTKKPNTQKKLSSNFKRYTIPSHSQSLPLTFSLSLSREVELSLTLTLSFRACHSVVGTVADCSRRCRCLSLSSVHLRLAQSFSLSGWWTTSQSKDSLFFLGVLVIRMHCTWCLGVQSLLPYLLWGKWFLFNSSSNSQQSHHIGINEVHTISSS